MINVKLLRNNPKLIASKLWRRMFFLNTKNIINIEKIRKFLQIELEKLQYKYKIIITKYNNDKYKKNFFLNEKKKISFFLKIIYKKFLKFKKKIKKYYSYIPNVPDSHIPYGIKYENNKIINQWGQIKKNKKYKNYMQLKKKFLDWESAQKITGSKFTFIKGNMALLHRALGQFMLDLHTFKHGYTETYVPYLVNKKSLYCTGQIPKFTNKLFHILNSKKKYTLISTGEIPLTNTMRNTTILKKYLPIMLTTKTPCFRLESKSYGRKLKGLIRMYQFDKVELVQMTSNKESFYTLEKITVHAEKVLQLLQLPYRKILLCAGELGFGSTKTYDLEVWFPSQKRYKEVSSCSNMKNFQSRRMNAKYFSTNNSKKKKLLHTLNGSGLALSRILAAILENYQDNFGNIKIPKILSKKYMNGLKFI
ncbi:serine--tRNA ligase [Buchnera aphidicola (Mollitrichosiphum nigrofasciatum)]|uniref:serine--tRNA ligase n=1 Tax=Buchnera aphidicola TaxID=9 RepID=UPI0031B857DA